MIRLYMLPDLHTYTCVTAAQLPSSAVLVICDFDSKLHRGCCLESQSFDICLEPRFHGAENCYKAIFIVAMRTKCNPARRQALSRVFMNFEALGNWLHWLPYGCAL